MAFQELMELIDRRETDFLHVLIEIRQRGMVFNRKRGNLS